MPRARIIHPDGICASCKVSMHQRCGGRCKCEDSRCTLDLMVEARRAASPFFDYTSDAREQFGDVGIARMGKRFIAYAWCSREELYHHAPDSARSYSPNIHSFDGSGVKAKGITFKACAACRADGKKRCNHSRPRRGVQVTKIKRTSHNRKVLKHAMDLDTIRALVS